MQKDDYPNFVALLAKTWMLYDKPINPDVCELMFDALMGYALEDIKRAINQHISDPAEGRFIPKPANIVKYLTGTEDQRAKHAWSLVMESVKKDGWYGSPRWDDPAISRAVANLGGWQHICDMEWDDEPFLAKRFEELYKLNSNSLCLPVPMIGQFEKDAKNQIGRDGPVSIGSLLKGIKLEPK